jgi:hypothetical protein
VSGRKGRKRRPRGPAPSGRAPEAVGAEELDEGEEPAVRDEREALPRRIGPFGGGLFGAATESLMPPIGRSIGRGILTVVSQPIFVVLAIVLSAGAWLAFVAIGFEGSPGRLVDVLALPPISTYFDLGTGSSLYGLGPSVLVFLGISVALRSVIYSILSGAIVEALEDGRITTYGVLRGLTAIPTVLVVHTLAFSLIVAGNLVFPVLGPGIGFLAFVSALVAGLFFLGFAPTAAIRQGRPVAETVRRSGRAAMLPGSRHLVLCSLYFFLALPVVVGFAPGATEITANPTLATWIFVFVVNVVHLGFMAAFAYRWIVAEPHVPEEPVRRRQAARAPTSRSRARR